MIEQILSELKSGAINAITKKLGISMDKGLEICSEFIPDAMAQVKGVTENPEKMSAIMGKLMMGDYSKFLEDKEENFDDVAEEEGKSILSMLFDGFDIGKKAEEVSAKSGVETSIIMKFLPLMATALMGAVSKNAGELMMSLGSGDNPLGSLLGGEGDTSLDDIAEMAGSFLKK